MPNIATTSISIAHETYLEVYKDQHLPSVRL
jgi:hypothetical protein